ncbi:MAG: hypothetical protein PHX07_01640 [Candidatus Marinimicrobia bacterium]|nr:hypothetical protein [Candidatus Neomarinimicrobiota bacterium]MDD4960917.1 hypothetical protein [Candidatus Neomarinimicrobiota bacterium]
MRFGLLGYGIQYSMSPVIHTMIARAVLSYELFDVAPEDFELKLSSEMAKLSGFNVTIPYKKTILRYCHEFDSLVQRLGAANTVLIRNNIWKAYNTDFPAFIRVMENHIPDYLAYHPVVVGYGGVARAAVHGLKHLDYVSISLIGGKSDKERRAFLNKVRPDMDMRIFDNLPEMSKLWINCTPAGNIDHPRIPPCFNDMQEGDFLFDLNYMPRPTYLEQYAKKRGVTHINGLRMLILQALEAQKIWLGTAVMDEKEVDNILYMINQ